MKWSETIRFSEPLQQACLVANAPSQSWDELLRAREQSGYERGRREAENALSQQMVQERAKIADLQHGILESLSQAVPHVIRETEAALISLAMEAAGRIVAGLPISAELVEAVVREALRQAEDQAEVLVQLNAEDLALLRQQNPKILNGLPEGGPLRFVPSGEVTRGGCMVQTRLGLIDARREVKLEQLVQKVNS